VEEYGREESARSPDRFLDGKISGWLGVVQLVWELVGREKQQKARTQLLRVANSQGKGPLTEKKEKTNLHYGIYSTV